MLKVDEAHPYVQKALGFIPEFEKAINQVIEDGDWETYCNSVNEYDKFLWDAYHNETDTINPINIVQSKKYSSFRETLLLPLWTRIKNRLSFETHVPVNKSVAQVIFDDGECQYKDLDGGLYINQEYMGNQILTPVLVNEDKGGHFCATQASNVNGIFRKFKDLNQNILTITTTDNKVTIGKDKDFGFMSSTNYIFSLRGKNLTDFKTHNHLVPERFRFMETHISERLNTLGLEPFLIKNLKITKKHTKTIRESIDEGGVMVNY